MGRSRYKIFNNDFPYFLTITTVEWMPLFANKNLTQIVIDSLNFLVQNNRIELYGYVILENHLHLIAISENLTKEIANFKSYSARKIIEFLSELHYNELLKKLKFYKLSTRSDRLYQVWQEGNHPEQILSLEMMREKLDYIHNNPLRRGYVDDPLHWVYSSARNYNGCQGIIDINMDWM
ncbi:MAG: REP-associated tyrosine transposase [Chloroflexota bacterium]